MNKEKMDIILQGPMYDYTPRIAEEYLKLDFVNNIIISCWDTCPYFDVPNNTVVVRSKDVSIPGLGNRNRQIKSSRAGMSLVSTEFSAKMRTDQIISTDSMYMLYDYYSSRKDYNTQTTSEKPYNKIGVHGMCRDFAFHPIDHIFWGNTQDLIKLFNVEYDFTPEPNDSSGLLLYVRSETYLALSYVLRFYKNLSYIMERSDEYLIDNGDKRLEAINISDEIMKELFIVFPKTQLSWIKYGMPLYHYDVMESIRGGRAYWADTQL